MDIYCTKCHKNMDERNFYKSNNTEKYPTGYLDICKKCATMHVDNWDPNSYLWIIQELDMPYMPDEWNKLLATYGKDKSKINGTSIIGRYIAKTRLKQYRDFRWADTEFLQELKNSEKEQAMKRQGYSAAQITEYLTHGAVSLPDKPLEIPDFDPAECDINTQAEALRPSDEPEDYFSQQLGFTDADLGLELTDDDKKMLCLKWGKAYKPDEWIRLEQLYNEMMESYDIQTAGHIDTLKLICKTSLKAHQLVDMGDLDGYQKMSRVYDQLMKSGKFTAAQNKAEGGEYVDSVGELVALCEQGGFITKFYIDKPNDKVDRTIMDIQKYTYNLVNEETNLSAMIEHSLAEIEKDREREAIINVDSIDDDDLDAQLFEDEAIKPITTKDYEEFNEFQDSLSSEVED